jgi:putative copper export protein
MTENPNYEGLLAIDNRWSSAILAKHLVIAFMVVIAIYQTWILHPRIAHLALRQAHRLDIAPEDTSRQLRRQVNLMRLNFYLGLLVLALTAIARMA